MHLSPLTLASKLYCAETETDCFKLGIHVSARLRLVAQALPAWHSAHELLAETADLIEQQSDPTEEPKNLGSAARGFVGTQPIWACLIVDAGRTISLSGDSWRALMVAWIIDHLVEGKDVHLPTVKSLHPLVKTFDKRSINCDDDALRSYLAHPSWNLYRTALGWLDRCFFEAGTSPKSSDAAKDILSAVHHKLIYSRDEYNARSGNRTHRELVHPSLIEGIAPTLPTNSSSLGGTANTEYLVLSPPSDADGRSHSERRAAERSSFLRQRVLSPGSDHALSPLEARECSLRLVVWIDDQALSPKLRVAAFVLLLSLITSEGYNDIFIALHSIASGASNDHFRNPPDGWTVVRRIPSALSHAKLPLHRDIPPCANEFELLLPNVTNPIFCAIQSGAMKLMDFADLDVGSRALTVQLKQLTPRFSELRSRMAIPATIFRQTGDPAAVQMLVGSDLGQSAAPLAYFAMPVVDAEAAWSRAVSEACGLTVPVALTSGPSHWCGAQTAAVSDDLIRQLVADGISATSVRLKDGISIKAHDALVIYSARLFQAATGHRGHASLGDIPTSWLDPDGCCLLSDKPSDQTPQLRLCAIPKFVVDQILLMLRVRSRLELDSPQSQSIRSPLTSDESPRLFWLMGPNGGRPIASKDLQAQMLTGLPVNLFRARLRRLMTRAGVSPRLIYTQLGHVWNGNAPFDEHSIDSAQTVTAALGEVIEKALHADGWIVLGTGLLPKGYQASVLPTQSFSTPFEKAAEHEISRLRSGLSECALSRRNKTTPQERAAHMLWADEAILALGSAVAPGSPVAKNIEITALHVDDWILSISERWRSQPARVQDCLRLLRARLIWNRRSKGWTGLLPPLAFLQLAALPSIVGHHLQASILSRMIRAELCKPGLLKRTDPQTARWSRLAGYLILDRVVFDQQQLRSALEAVSRQVSSETGPGAIPGFLEISCGASSRAVSLKREPSILSHWLVGCPVGDPTKIENTLIESVSREFGGAGKAGIGRLFSLARAASRVDMPGVEWVALDRKDHGTLDLARTRDWTFNQLGAERGSIKGTPTDLVSGAVSKPAFESRQRSSHPRTRHEGYKRLRLGLYELTEPGAEVQEMEKARYVRAKALISNTVREPKQDLTVALLASFAGSYLATARRSRLSTAYKGMTDIGLRMLRSLGRKKFEELSPDEIEDMYVQVVHMAPQSSRRRVAEGLYSFHKFHHDKLGGVYFSRVFGEAGIERPSEVLANVITDREQLAVAHLLNNYYANSEITQGVRDQGIFLSSAIIETGARVGELTHSQQRDAFTVSGETYLYIRNTPLGLIKTASSRRVVAFSPGRVGRVVEQAELSCAIAIERKESSPEHPLITFGSSINGGHDLLGAIRQTWATVTGTSSISLHAGRHTASSRSLQAALSSSHQLKDPYLDVLEVSSKLGHKDITTSFEHYWHLQHLQSVPLPPVPLNSSELALLTGNTALTIRKAKSRKKWLLMGAMEPKPIAHASFGEVFGDIGNAAHQLDSEYIILGIRTLAYIHQDFTLEQACKRSRLDPAVARRLVAGFNEIETRFHLRVMTESTIKDAGYVGFDYQRLKGRIKKLMLGKWTCEKLIALDKAVNCTNTHDILTAAARTSRPLVDLEKSALKSVWSACPEPRRALSDTKVLNLIFAIAIVNYSLAKQISL